MTEGAPLTATEILATVTSAMRSGGYSEVDDLTGNWRDRLARVFEDDYNVVGVVVFDSLGRLLSGWPDFQGELVDLISRGIGKAEAKAWDGYLVLLTPGISSIAQREIMEIRRDTRRTRKLVATGDDLRQLADAERVVRSLLPLNVNTTVRDSVSALDLLPDLLAAHDIRPETTANLLDAFTANSPMMPRIHER